MSRLIFILALTSTLFFIGCERHGNITEPSNNDDGSSVSFYFTKPAGLDTLVVTAEAMVSAPDMDTILVDLTVYPNSVEGTIDNIPAGLHRKFEIFTYDADPVLTYYGHAFADVPAGQIITVSITLYPINHTGTVIIVGTFAPFPHPQDDIVFRANYGGSFDLYRMDTNANNIVNLTNTPALEERYARISPDKQKIAFIRGDVNGLFRPYLMDIDGENLVHLSNIHPGSRIGFIDWAPNGEQVVVNSYWDGDAEIYTYDLSTNQATQLTFNSANDWVPQWSPADNWIAYQSDESGVFKINLIHPDGSGKHLLLPNAQLEEKYPSFSPDGARVLFYGRDFYGTWDLFIADLSGTNLLRLTNTPGINEHYGCWSPNGEEILFTWSDGLNKGLYLFDLHGGGITPLLDSPYSNEEFPHWR
jgi:TolB protein